MSASWLNFFLSQPSSSFFLLFLELLFLCFCLPNYSLPWFEVFRFHWFIITIRQLFKRHCGFHQKMTSHEPDSAWRCKAGFSDNIDWSRVCPYVPFIELNHHFKRFLWCFIIVFGDITWNEGSELLVNFVVLMMAVHSPDIVENVFVDCRSQLFVF